MKNVRFGPVLDDGMRAVHWRLYGDTWKFVGWLMPGADDEWD